MARGRTTLCPVPVTNARTLLRGPMERAYTTHGPRRCSHACRLDSTNRHARTERFSACATCEALHQRVAWRVQCRKNADCPTLAETSNRPCVITGLDALLERVQPFGPFPSNVWQALERSWRIWRFGQQDGWFPLFQQLHQETVKPRRGGQTIIIETSLLNERVLRDAAQTFAPVDGYLIGINPLLAVSEQ